MIGLLIISLIVGFIYILVGFFVKKNPTSINGYDKLDEYQRKILPDYLQKLLTTTGIITIIGAPIFILLKWYIVFFVFLILPIFIGTLILLFKMRNPRNKKRTNFEIIFISILIIIILAFLISSSKEHSICFESEGIKITGLYRENIAFSSIADLTLADNLPTIQLRTNGLGLGPIRKGYFSTKEMGTVKLFLTSTSAPYIQIQTISGQYIFINFRDANNIMLPIYRTTKSFI